MGLYVVVRSLRHLWSRASSLALSIVPHTRCHENPHQESECACRSFGRHNMTAVLMAGHALEKVSMA